jgi:site-specific DNA-methyltransferase (adenine-specific)
MGELIRQGVKVDVIITDPPYGTTACKWDSVIPFGEMWKRVNGLIKSNGAVVLFGSEPFSSALRMSNIKNYKYDWIWEKTNAVDFALAKIRPRQKHENIIVFSNKKHIYNPQMEQGKPYIDKPRKRTNNIHNSNMPKLGIINRGTRYPSSIQKFSNGNNGNVHPTQKPVPLMEYLIKTYTNPGEWVLDFTMGSGTTGVACRRTGRNFIGIEQEEKYFDIAFERITKTEEGIKNV